MAKPALNEKTKDLQPFKLDDMRLHESVNARWRVVLSKDVDPDDFENPALWSVVCQKWRAFDTVEAVSKTSWNEGLVISAERGCTPILKLLRTVTFELPPENVRGELPKGYKIEFDPLTATYSALRESDRHPMGIQTKTYEEARAALVSNAIFR